MSRHPIQPLERDASGVVRFKANAIVKHLLDAGPFDMNDVARLDVSKEDQEQFAQLIGYSLGGFGDLSYVSEDTYAAAVRMTEEDITEAEARIYALEGTLADIRYHLRDAAVAAFNIHQDDLHP